MHRVSIKHRDDDSKSVRLFFFPPDVKKEYVTLSVQRMSYDFNRNKCIYCQRRFSVGNLTKAEKNYSQF